MLEAVNLGTLVAAPLKLCGIALMVGGSILVVLGVFDLLKNGFKSLGRSPHGHTQQATRNPPPSFPTTSTKAPSRNHHD